ncbi:MAG: Clp protease N-terminal domain-containing protein [Gemmatimonas sp.]
MSPNSAEHAAALRPFPDHPSLEFDRKAAKQLLRALRAGEQGAIDRARARGVETYRDHTRFSLSDTQLIVAREYGFSSWPRLVQYHGDIARQARGIQQTRTREEWDREASWFAARHKARQKHAARSLAAFVPRFYGMTPAQVLDLPITEADARLAVARERGQPSWNALLEARGPERRQLWAKNPHHMAAEAMDANDLERLREIVQNHPEIVNPPTSQREPGATLANTALGGSPREGPALRTLSPEMRAYLESIGVDLQTELNRRLCNMFTSRSIEKVKALLDAGANPDWMAPDGFTMLEHALLTLWNGDVIDLLASKSKPRDALWINAGLGDVAGVARFLDKNGKPKAAARDLRSPFDCTRLFRITPLVEPDDEELLLEALVIAACNGRANVIDYLASRGVNLDNMAWGVPVVNIAVGNGWLESAEALIRNGANLDIASENDSNGTARDMARIMWENSNDSERGRRIAELCGIDVETLRSEREANSPQDPALQRMAMQSLAFAQQAAAQAAKSEVSAEHLLLGMLRAEATPLFYIAEVSGIDRERFRTEVMQRVLDIQNPPPGIAVPISAEVQNYLSDAQQMARKRFANEVAALDVFYAMTRQETGYASELLREYGASVQKLNKSLRCEVLRESQ